VTQGQYSRSTGQDFHVRQISCHWCCILHPNGQGWKQFQRCKTILVEALETMGVLPGGTWQYLGVPIQMAKHIMGRMC
jgi:hypothetical protein